MNDLAQQNIPPAVFKKVFSNFPTGVAVVTTYGRNGAPLGMTIGSLASLSLDPALLCWNMRKVSSIQEDFVAAAGYAVHILAENQLEVGALFASSAKDKFDSVTWCRGIYAPLLEGCKAVLECSSDRVIAAGDHMLMIGTIRSADVEEDEGCTPLIYYRGGFASCGLPARA